jgi:pilus assembly protein CpaC
MKFNAISPGSPWTIGGVNGGATFPEAILDGVPQLNPITGEFIEFKDGVAVPVFSSVPYGPTIQEFVPTPLSIADKGLFATFLNSDLLFNLVLDAAKEKGLAKVLAEPTLTTLTGQEASFLAGGEFPIPVIEGQNGSVSITYKEYGVGLKFLPTVLDSGMINLKLNITVSELSNANSVAVGSANVSSAIFVPGLTKRSANSTVVLGSGQTMGIAGLISESLRENVDKLPFLGEVPILGMLFSSQEYIKGQTELVIFVTPHFAQPIQRDQVKLPTDAFVEPSDLEFYLLGRIEGQPPEQEQGQTEQAPTSDLGKGGLEGTFGHDL